jgi:mono/diheme cytochrome c family protein
MVLFAAVSLSGPTLACADEPPTARGRASAQLFAQNCVQCHGMDGHGVAGRRTMPDIPDFTDSTWQRSKTDAELLVSILNGKGRFMPAWWGRLSDQQAADLVIQVRTFGPALPAPTPAPVVSAADSSDLGKQLAQLQRQWDELEKQLRSLPPAAEGAASTMAAAPVTAAATPLAQAAGPPTSGAARFFGQNCAGCHTIGGGALTGPDLKDVTKRRDRDWLVRLLLDPKSIIHSGDPYALELLSKARGVVMPNIFGMTAERASDMVTFLETQSQLPKSWYSELPISDRKLTESDVEQGRELFSGLRPFMNGGPACIACHAADHSKGHDGGRLGPDLTKVYERVGGRTALAARLWTPVTPTMLPLYQQHPLQENEVLSLVAFLQESAAQGVEHDSAPPLGLLLPGLGGAVAGLAFLGLLGSRLALNGKARGG